MSFQDTLNSIIKHDKEQAEKKDKEIQEIRNVQFDTETGHPVRQVETVQPIPLD